MSDRQWRDVQGMLKAQKTRLDNEYLQKTASLLGLTDLLRRALEQVG